MDNVKNIVLVLSGKGGVGKSSVTTQLALSLSLQGHSVGVLDVDLTGPSMPRFFGVEGARVRQAPGGWIPVPVYVPGGIADKDGRKDRIEDKEGEDGGKDNGRKRGMKLAPGPVYCMSLGFLLKSRGDAVVWRGPKKTAMVRQFLSDVQWGSLEFLLIDTPPGTSDEHISLLETLLKMTSTNTDINTSTSTGTNGSTIGTNKPQLSGAVLVTTPQAVSTADVKKELNFCAKTGLRVLGVVENMAGFVCPSCAECTNVFSKGGGEAMAREFGVSFLGSVPVDPAFVGLVEEGIVPTYPGEGAAGTSVGVGAGDKAGFGQGGDSDAAAGQSKDNPWDETLIGKYTQCSLYPIFRGFTETLVRLIDEGKEKT